MPVNQSVGDQCVDIYPKHLYSIIESALTPWLSLLNTVNTVNLIPRHGTMYGLLRVCWAVLTPLDKSLCMNNYKQRHTAPRSHRKPKHKTWTKTQRMINEYRRWLQRYTTTKRSKVGQSNPEHSQKDTKLQCVFCCCVGGVCVNNTNGGCC